MATEELRAAIDIDPPEEDRIGETLSQELSAAFDRAQDRIVEESDLTVDDGRERGGR